MTDAYDAIVVGGGWAGAAAATTLGRAGRRVVVFDAGSPGGAGSALGGWVFGEELTTLWPDWRANLPVDRSLRTVRLFLAPTEAYVSFDYDFPASASARPVGVEPERVRPWLRAQVEAAGGQWEEGVRVEGLYRTPSGAVGGVLHDGETVHSPVTIVATGGTALGSVSSTLEGVGRTDLLAYEVWKVEESRLEGRLGLGAREGSALRFVLGGPAQRVFGFADVLREQVLLGVLCPRNGGTMVPDPARALDRLRGLPPVRGLLADAARTADGARTVPRTAPRNPLASPGLLVTGASAGLWGGNGLFLSGIPLAVRSGRLAAEAALAGPAGEPVAALAERYERALVVGGVMHEARRAGRQRKQWLENPRLYDRYPGFLFDFFRASMTELGTPKERVFATLRRTRHSHRLGWVRLGRDARALGRSGG